MHSNKVAAGFRVIGLVLKRGQKIIIKKKIGSKPKNYSESLPKYLLNVLIRSLPFAIDFSKSKTFDTFKQRNGFGRIYSNVKPVLTK